MRLIIRGYAYSVAPDNPHGRRARTLRFEDKLDIPAPELDEALPELARRHTEALAGDLMHMIEFEFPDEPDEMRKYLRFGTTPLGMVQPLAVNLEDLQRQ